MGEVKWDDRRLAAGAYGDEEGREVRDLDARWRRAQRARRIRRVCRARRQRDPSGAVAHPQAAPAATKKGDRPAASMPTKKGTARTIDGTDAPKKDTETRPCDEKKAAAGGAGARCPSS